MVVAMPLLAVAALSVGACSSSNAKPAGEASHDEFTGETRDTEIKHEACDPKGHAVRSYGAADPLAPSVKLYVTHVYDGSAEICSFSDLNGDGRIDVYSYFGPDGKIRRREASYRIDKALDEIALYRNGEIDSVMRETNFDGKLDTWDYYENGKLVRRERDKNGDGRIDEWWTFQPGTENATIVQADLRTGKPDPTQTINIGLGFAQANAPPPIEFKKAKADAGVDAPSAADGGKDAQPTPPSAAGAPAGDGTFADAGKKGPK